MTTFLVVSVVVIFIGFLAYRTFKKKKVTLPAGGGNYKNPTDEDREPSHPKTPDGLEYDE